MRSESHPKYPSAKYLLIPIPAQFIFRRIPILCIHKKQIGIQVCWTLLTEENQTIKPKVVSRFENNLRISVFVFPGSCTHSNLPFSTIGLDAKCKMEGKAVRPVLINWLATGARTGLPVRIPEPVGEIYSPTCSAEFRVYALGFGRLGYEVQQ